MEKEEIRVSADLMEEVLFRLFTKLDFPSEKAQLLAAVHTETTLSGVNSHGINRVPLFVDYIKSGLVDVFAEAEPISTIGSIERWDGHSGPGVVNATKCMDRAIALAKAHGMGLVALRNTNHWMRGGTYGHQAAAAGCISILFTNTIANMPPWGGKESRIGNNPLIVSIPRKGGHIVLDMAMSQFSFGKIDQYRLQGQELPYFGGWDEADELSKDPERILQKERGLPIGYWKGSALSIILDMLVTLLSAGNSTYRISQQGRETNISQVFLCIDPGVFQDQDLQEQLLNEIIDYVHDVEPMKDGGRTFFPGERSAETRARNVKEKIPVSQTVWETVVELAE